MEFDLIPAMDDLAPLSVNVNVNNPTTTTDNNNNTTTTTATTNTSSAHNDMTLTTLQQQLTSHYHHQHHHLPIPSSNMLPPPQQVAMHHPHQQAIPNTTTSVANPSLWNTSIDLASLDDIFMNQPTSPLILPPPSSSTTTTTTRPYFNNNNNNVMLPPSIPVNSTNAFTVAQQLPLTPLSDPSILPRCGNVPYNNNNMTAATTPVVVLPPTTSTTINSGANNIPQPNMWPTSHQQQQVGRKRRFSELDDVAIGNSNNNNSTMKLDDVDDTNDDDDQVILNRVNNSNNNNNSASTSATIGITKPPLINNGVPPSGHPSLSVPPSSSCAISSSTTSSQLSGPAPPMNTPNPKSTTITPTLPPLDAAPSPTGGLEDVIIDHAILAKMGGLSYAELYKERAREAYKELKKSEHLANGNFDRMKRRKKNDTSMTAKEKYQRRLRMNQDSAAAARHAQEVYVQVLEKLVGTSESERRGFVKELSCIREHNSCLRTKVSELEEEVVTLQGQLCCMKDGGGNECRKEALGVVGGQHKKKERFVSSDDDDDDDEDCDEEEDDNTISTENAVNDDKNDSDASKTCTGNNKANAGCKSTTRGYVEYEPEDKKNDPILLKFLEMFKPPTANIRSAPGANGMLPARAV